MRIEDALNATKAAVDEGIVAGGGVALLRASQILKNNNLNAEEKIGAEIVARALAYPRFVKLLIMLGRKALSLVNTIMQNPEQNFGYDAGSDEYKDLVRAGIIDPKKVERSALQNAISIAGMFLTTEALIVDVEKEKPEIPMPNPGMGGMGMY